MLSEIQEQGRIVRIEAGKTWVESINRSACAQCSAKAVCGQSAMAKWAETANLLAIDETDPIFKVGDQITFTVQADALARAALLVYLLPLVTMIAMAAGFYRFLSHDLVALAGAALGLWLGMKLVRACTVKAPKGMHMGLKLGHKL
ncbi:SoxR reducing system RseC family protein [Simiduia sp. 21SJ11W-1]|uniref:SoxR reducing system RseC family protein n=1 Tax=Simiduia sp. 21SJ11W-1 TaxID=2909669 RepID=UPI00209D8D6D|nr:SoxR reducing system RseC family protein [Simiduia sp. 21SJ11W-1]UTA46288.1 SoxR reducing system RseC family protein [Simiduia sp. 21SJ11W-1]